MASFYRSILEWDRQVTRRIFEKAIAWGKRAVAVLTEIGDSHELARAHFPLGYHLVRFRSRFIEELVKQEPLRLRAIELYRNGIEFSEGDAYLIGLFHFGLAHIGAEASVPFLKKALQYGEETRDNYLKALALDYLAYDTYWEAHATDDPDLPRSVLLADGERPRLLIDGGEYARRSMEASRLADYFDVVLARDEVEFLKPDPRHLLQVLEELNATPQSSIFVGDTETDQRTARAAGISFIGVPSNESWRKRMEGKEGSVLVSTLSEITELI